MPSEKSRYLKRDQGPPAPLNFGELGKQLNVLGADRLAKIVWARADRDKILYQALMVSVVILSSHENPELVNAAIDYAFHFPDYIRYTERGHGQILEEIKSSLEVLVNNGQVKFALSVAAYAIKRAQETTENFEDDWGWRCSLENLSKWSQEVKTSEGLR